ncbi:MAG: CHASE2 domain-containing protein [Pedosphaera sp.]|nr:CHASE2 domain-containing protein [Pedosphaera sp.]
MGELGVDDDFVARRHFAGRFADGEVRPSLTWAAARVLELSSIKTSGGAGPARWLRYYGPPFTLPHVSVSQALDPKTIDDAVFRDKVVFVGARPMAGLFKERRDEFRSPFHSWRKQDLFMPGVEVHATQMLNLLREDWLKRLNSSLELSVVLFVGVLFGAGLLWLRPVPATVAAVVRGGAATAAAAAMFLQFNVWFPWLLVTAVQIPVALGGSVLFHSLDWYRTRRRLEATKRADDAHIREQAALIEKAHDAILVQTLDGKTTYANPSAERLYGGSQKELLTGAADTLSVNAAAANARKIAMERGEWNGELCQQARSGKSFTVESRWTLLRDEAGEPAGVARNQFGRD